MKIEIRLFNKVKDHLFKRLVEEYSFWSYDKESIQNISDWNLIKHVLIQLDLPDTDLLFQIYSKRKIKRVWLAELVPQGDFLLNMNVCFALLYFDIKKPVTYLKRMETYYLNKEIKDNPLKSNKN